MDSDGKKALAREWLSKCGTKGSVRAFLSQTVTQECQSTGGKISGCVGAAEVARLTGLSAVGLPPKELQATLEEEIHQNQDNHGIPEDKRVQQGSSFWLHKFWYVYIKPSDETSTSKSTEKMCRSSADAKAGDASWLNMLGNGQSGSSTDQAAPKQSAAEARRLKKANGLMEGLMKTLQLSRTQALVARSRNEAGLKQKLKQLEDVELWAVSTMSSLQDNPPTVDVLDALQDEVLAHKATLNEAWGLNKRSLEAPSGSDSKSQRVPHSQRAELLWVGGS